jgi:pyruvate/2-oxoglutarate dehydrogenase complex dihydrolipoamide acyltransferase (E2) component
MAIGDRSDGVLLRKLPGFRKMFPYLMRTRTESTIYHAQRLRVGHTLAWLDQANAGREKKISIFAVILAAGVRTLALRPEANRFVVGRRIYQRRTIDLSFVVKRELTEEAAETTVKIAFDPRSTIWDVAKQVTAVVQATREDRTSRDESASEIVTKLPRSLTRLAMGVVRTLDYFGLLPAAFIKGDGLYASAFLANLGSIGFDAVFHHLYEWGNAPIFVVVGKTKKEPVAGPNGELEAQDVMDLKFTLDERITDGVYFVATIDMFRDLVENPEKLEFPPESLPDPFALA